MTIRFFQSTGWLARCIGGLGLAAALAVALLASFSLEKRATHATGVPVVAAQSSAAIALTAWTPPDPAYKITIEVDGIYQLSHNYLQNAGLPVDSIEPATFRMFFLGTEIPIRITGDGDAAFEAGEAILFYGRGVDSLYHHGLLSTNKYTEASVYWLTYGGADGLRMSTRSGNIDGNTPNPFLHPIHMEKVNGSNYFSNRPFEPNADHWYWDVLQPTGFAHPFTRTYTFDVQNLPVGVYTEEIQVAMAGAYDLPGSDRHHLRILINGTQIFDNNTSWTDFELFTASATFPSSLLQEGANTVQLVLEKPASSFFDIAYLNWIDIRYHDSYTAEDDQLSFGSSITDTLAYQVGGFSSGTIDVYDVGDPLIPQQLDDASISGSGPYTIAFGSAVDASSRFIAVTPAAYLTPTADAISQVAHLASPHTPADLLDTNNGADWIAITHGDFWHEIQPLVAHRAADYRVALIDVQEIYDSFNGGMMSAEAIRDFLAYAYHNWQAPRPRFVLLGGGGVVDMRKYDSSSKNTYVPPFLALADPFLGETAADNRFVTFTGDDILPEMSIGRFPVYTPQEMALMVDKTIHYESTPVQNDWNQNLLFVSDDLEGGGGDFYHFSDAIADGYSHISPTIKYLPDPYTSTKTYLGQTCDTSNPAKASECTATISETLNITGALFVSYVGHAVKNGWAVEELMNATLARSFTNYDKLSIFLAMACYEGFFHDPPPSGRSLAEEYLLNPNGGAVASWSPSGFGVATGHDWLEQGLFIELFTHNVKTLGEAITRAKYYMHEHAPSGKYDDLVDTFLMFGDPALEVQLATGSTPPTDTPTPTATATATTTPTGTNTPTATATATSSSTTTPTATATEPSTTATATATATATSPPTATATSSPTATATPTPTDTALPAATPTPTATGTQTAEPPTATATSTSPPAPTTTPTATASPTTTSTVTPTATPTSTPVSGAGGEDDMDADGVPDFVENNVPNLIGNGSGDGNGDGIPDAQQTNVVSLPNAVDGGYVTIFTFAGNLRNVRALLPAVSPPAGVRLPQGLFYFEVHDLPEDGEVLVSFHIHSGDVFGGYWKFGPTPNDSTDHWYTFRNGGSTGTSGADRTILLRLVDGERGDADLTADDVLITLGGPGGRDELSVWLPFVSRGNSNNTGAVRATERQTPPIWLPLVAK